MTRALLTLKVLRKASGMNMSREMAYKWNFFIKMGATLLQDFIGPIIILLIYSTTSGIPGWTFYEFLLFQGTLTLVMGVGHFLFVGIPVEVIHNIRNGTFDKYLLNPVNVLVYLTVIAMDWDGLAQVFSGIVLLVIAFAKLNIALISYGMLAYAILVLLAFLFQYAVMILVSALAFLMIQSWALLDLFFKLADLARYPSNVYGSGVQFFITFLFPVSISAFYPAQALLNGFNLLPVLKVGIPVIIFFLFSLWLWKAAMKKYASAGG
jgi:ABC-2 type transport system permease protein